MKKLWVGFALVVFIGYLCAVAWHGLRTSPAPRPDDVEWAWKSTFFPSYVSSGEEYERQCVVPSLYRWYTNLLPIDSNGLISVPTPHIDGTVEYSGVVPVAMYNKLLLASIALFAAMIVLLWLVACKVLEDALLASISLVPILVSPTFWNGVACRLGPDAMLCLMLAATLASWLWLKGRRQLVITSIFCGLACASKQNGILVLAAWCGYLAVTKRLGSWKSALALAIVIAAAVFCLVNPATWSGPWAFLQESIRLRTLCAEQMAARYGRYGHHSWWRFLNDALPLWPLVPVYLGLLWNRRKEVWFAPVAWWSVFLVFGTLFTLPSPARRYLAPMQLGLYFPFMLCLVSYVREKWNKRLA